MTLDSSGFRLGDFNQINLVILSLVGSKTIFPLVGMFLIKTEYEQDGLIGTFVTPMFRINLLISKIVTAVLWSISLIVFSALLVIVVELILFKDLNIFYVVKDHVINYVLLIVYVVPYIIIGMFLSYVLSHVLMPMIVFIVLIVGGYLTQLFNSVAYMPSAIPEYIAELPKDLSLMVLPFIFLYVFALLIFLMFRYLFMNKDY